MDASVSDTPIVPPAMPRPLGVGTKDVNAELNRAIEQLYLAVVKVELEYDRVCILYSKEHPESVPMEFNWTDYFTWYVSLLSPSEQDLARQLFSSRQLLKRFQAGEDSYSADFSFTKNSLLDWITISAFLRPSDRGGTCAYILVRLSGEDHLLKNIVDQYVYNNCDYFIYLDAQNNCYTMFSGSTSGTPLLPTQCDDYSSEIVKYAKDFVIPEDRKMVVHEMSLPRILDVLDRQEVHSFSCGIIDPILGYTRKRLDFRYYDRNRQMILFSRTDITSTYLEAERHQKELQEALFRAQTDPLTGLLNYQGIVDKITDNLSCEEGHFALMFLDLDNFKAINDTLGHCAGDELLRQIAKALRANTKPTDLVGRVGGDEFVVFLCWIHSHDEVKACAQALCDSIQTLPFLSSCSLPTSCSIGIALAPEDGTDYYTLVKMADRRLYQAKLAGKNCYAI